MADEIKVEAEAAAEAPAKIADAVAETVETVTKGSAKAAKSERAKAVRRAKRKAAEPKARRSSARKTRNAARKTAAQERIETVTNTNFFEAVPAFAPFQTLLTEASERGQDATLAASLPIASVRAGIPCATGVSAASRLCSCSARSRGRWDGSFSGR